MSSASSSAASDSKEKETQPDLSAKGLFASDSALKDVSQSYLSAASTSDVEAVTAALEAKSHKVTVVKDAAAAVELLAGLLAKDKGTTVGFAGSTTLQEIGFIDYIKTRTDLTNYRELAATAQAKNDWASVGKYRGLSIIADYFFTSVAAVTKEGDLLTADLTGNRCGGLLSASNVVVVVGTNKIVKDAAAAEERLYKFALPLESARVRIAYKVKASAANNVAWLKGANPFGAKGRVHVVIVPGSYGF